MDRNQFALQQESKRQIRYKKKARRIQRIVKNMVFVSSVFGLKRKVA